jgi:hypothetical protein
MFYALAVMLPFVAGLQRYAVSYGFEGTSKSTAFRSARSAFLVVAAFAAVLCATHA